MQDTPNLHEFSISLAVLCLWSIPKQRLGGLDPNLRK
jgi:hypothetical protein